MPRSTTKDELASSTSLSLQASSQATKAAAYSSFVVTYYGYAASNILSLIFCFMPSGGTTENGSRTHSKIALRAIKNANSFPRVT
jgi:hypothetical protein